MNEVYLYFHAGSKNHGCEAIVRSSVKILKKTKSKIYLYSSNKDEDIDNGIEKITDKIETIENIIIKRYSFKHIFLAVSSRLMKHRNFYLGKMYHVLLNKNNTNGNIALSIGGDNYCYGGFPKILSYLNYHLNKKGAKTVLWGCSIEPNLIENKNIAVDLKRYALITARESITYNYLLKQGINKNTKLYPDPAFQLDTVNLDLPNGFARNNTIGVNISPLIIRCEQKAGATLNNYEALLQHIINTTDMQIALIPHVIWENNDDRKPLTELYNKFKGTGRVVLIEDYNCMELKGYIARCRMFIGARTHATIAAYSSCVPTLVVGYSVKAKGIAKDIFGTYENYVIPVQTLENQDDLINAFEWLKSNEDSIRKHLQKFIPGYCAKAMEAGEEVRKLMEN